MSKHGDPTNLCAWEGRVARLLLLAVPLAVSSCGGGGNQYPVRGQVFYEGQPAAGAVVFFHPQDDHAPTGDSSGGHASMADTPFGKVGPDGSFELTTYGKGRGARPGRYAVTISWTRPSPAGDGEDQDLLPAPTSIRRPRD